MAGKRLKLSALDKALLKHRAFEMVLILFYVEHIKKFALHAVQFTDSLIRPDGCRIPPAQKNNHRKVWATLVEDGILSQSESDELQMIVDYRNCIGHRIQLLVGDLSQESFARNFAAWTGIAYDQQALTSIKNLLETIKTGMSGKYVIPLLPDEIVFETAEKIYLEELRRLERQIKRLGSARCVETENELSEEQG